MNALRSLSRYCALALGSEWEVRFSGQETEAAFGRPFATVVTATPLTSTPHGPLFADCRQTFSISAFPTQGINGEASRMEAGRVERILWRAFAQGIDPALYSRQSNRGHPLRVPLFDYDGVGLYEAVGDEARAGVMRVVEPPTFAAIATADPSEFVVVGDVRLGWSESVAVALGGPLTERVIGTPEAA